MTQSELLTLPEHLSSPPVFSRVRVTRSLVLYVCFLIVVCPFVLFLLSIVLSIFLRYTDSDCPFGIFKLFLCFSEFICDVVYSGFMRWIFFSAMDSSIFVSNNNTLYSLRLYNLNSSFVEPSLYTRLVDGTTNRMIAIGTINIFHLS
jgi:hypothetical protein